MKKLKYLLFIFIIFLVPNVFAVSINSDSYSQKDSFNNSSRYDFTTSNTLGDDMSLLSVGTIGTRYNGKSYYFQFNFHKSLTANKFYELKVSSTTSDFTSNINKDDIVPLCYSSFAYNFNTKDCGDISVISVIRGSGNQSKDFTIRFSPLSSMTYWGFKFGGGFNALTGVSNFLVNNFDLTEVNADNTDEIINNDNQNTQNIIDNQNQNTQDIINNNDLSNINTQRNNFDTSTLNCGILYKYNLSKGQGFYASGSMYDDVNSYYTADYIPINNATKLVLENFNSTNNNGNIIIYNSSKVYMDYWGVRNQTINLPSGATYFRYSTTIPLGRIFKDIGCTSKLDSITSPNIDNGVGSDFFNNFSSQDFGLSQIITLPLTTIQSLANTSCVSLNIPIPFTNSNIPLPCMTQVYQTYIPSIFSIWQVVSFGIIAYFICIDIVHLVKGFKDPDSDKVEVLDL